MTEEQSLQIIGALANFETQLRERYSGYSTSVAGQQYQLVWANDYLWVFDRGMRCGDWTQLSHGALLFAAKHSPRLQERLEEQVQSVDAAMEEFMLMVFPGGKDEG